MPQSEPDRVELTKQELDQIRRLLDKATAELERGNLSQAHEALLAARHTYERLATQMARWWWQYGGDQQVLTLQLAQS